MIRNLVKSLTNRLKNVCGIKVITVTKRFKIRPPLFTKIPIVYLLLIFVPLPLEPALGAGPEETPQVLSGGSFQLIDGRSVGYIIIPLAATERRKFAVDGRNKSDACRPEVLKPVGLDSNEISGDQAGQPRKQGVSDNAGQIGDKLSHVAVLVLILEAVVFFSFGFFMATVSIRRNDASVYRAMRGH